MTPSVRGRERAVVATVLAGTAAGSGALVGFAAGVAAALLRVPPASPVVVSALVALALAGDLAHRMTGRPRPLGVTTQVPRRWTAMFSLRTAAALYGARLGVGPLTVLHTWLWWAAVVAGASLGPFPSALVGAAFGFVRIAVMVGLAQRALPAMGAAMAVVRRREGPVAWAAGAVVLVGCAVVVAAT